MSFSDVKKAQKQAESRKKNAEAFRVQEVFLRGDGDEVELYFNGTSDEPKMKRYHTLTDVGGRKFQAELCGAEDPDHDGCVFCWRSGKGDKRISTAREFAVFNTADSRFVHKTKNEKRSKEAKFDRFDYEDCTGEGCKACKRGLHKERRGRSRLRLGTTHSGALYSTNEVLGRKCMACGGKITTLGFRKGKKRVDSLEDVNDPEGWEREYKCSKCSGPTPADIWHAPITMRRSGVQKATSYQFFPGDVYAEPPKWVQKIEPLDLDALMPRTSQQQADLLEIPNPFSSKKKGSKDEDESYDEDEEDEESTEEEDEDEEF